MIKKSLLKEELENCNWSDLEWFKRGKNNKGKYEYSDEERKQMEKKKQVIKLILVLNNNLVNKLNE